MSEKEIRAFFMGVLFLLAIEVILGAAFMAGYTSNKIDHIEEARG